VGVHCSRRNLRVGLPGDRSGRAAAGWVLFRACGATAPGFLRLQTAGESRNAQAGARSAPATLSRSGGDQERRQDRNRRRRRGPDLRGTEAARAIAQGDRSRGGEVVGSGVARSRVWNRWSQGVPDKATGKKSGVGSQESTAIGETPDSRPLTPDLVPALLAEKTHRFPCRKGPGGLKVAARLKWVERRALSLLPSVRSRRATDALYHPP
jgi:hypothetical protein